MTATTIDPTLTVNEIVARFPATFLVFYRFGLDTCCGGATRLDEAARRDGLDLKDLLSALHEVIESR